MDNRSIMEHYKKGHIYTSRQIEEDAVFNSIKWKGKEVFEIGCGEGTLAKRIYDAGADWITAVDYVRHDWGQRGPHYRCMDYKCHSTEPEIVVMQGVLEHMDSPADTLEHIRILNPDTIISSSPCWMNPRGFVLQTLFNLFGYPITLADLHYLTPDDMTLEGYELSWTDIDHDWASGQKMIDDLRNRLPKVLDGVEANVEKLMHWLKKVPQQGLGATIIYKLEKI